MPALPTDADTVILLRAQGTAARDEAICRAAGWLPLTLTVMDIIPLPQQQRLPTLWRHADAVIWTSPSAARYTLPAIDTLPENIDCFAVGKATAAILTDNGIKHIYTPENGHDAAALLDLDFWQNKCGHVVIVRGENGRPLLPEVLTGRGWKVTLADIYRRQTTSPDMRQLEPIICPQRIAAVYATTTEAVRWWQKYIAPLMCGHEEKLLYLSHHERIRRAWEEAGARRVFCGELNDILPQKHTLKTTQKD